MARFRTKIPDFSVLDLKALFRARRYALEALKLLPDSPNPLLIEQVLDSMPRLAPFTLNPLSFPFPDLAMGL